jgi:predicted Fe-Mo cluster-binding NifX family protein
MQTLLVPIFNGRISSRLDCTYNFQLIKINDKKVQSIENIKILAKNQIEKLKSILSLKPDTIICNGLTEYYETELTKNNIYVIPSIYGNTNEVISQYVNGKLRREKTLN